MRKTIRIPGRVVFYMESTGWGQQTEQVTDPARLSLLEAMDGHRNADGSVTVEARPDVLDRLWREADHLADGYRYGDHDPDSLADYNAAKAMQRRVTQAR